MEIFCRGVPEHVPDNQLKRGFAPLLKDFGITVFASRKAGKYNAIITITDATHGQRVLDRYGQDDKKEKDKKEKKKNKQPVKLFGTRIYLEKGRNNPDEFLLRSLEDKQADSRTQLQHPEPAHIDLPSSFFVFGVSCGIWDYHNGNPVFVSCFELTLPGKIVFGRTTLRATLMDARTHKTYRLVFDYLSLSEESIHIGTTQQPSITVTGTQAPRLYESTMKIRNGQLQECRERVSSFGGEHQVVSTCLIYRFILQDRRDLTSARRAGHARHFDMHGWRDLPAKLDRPYSAFLNTFLDNISRQEIPYRVKFQMQKLVWNAYLSPRRASQLYAQVLHHLSREGSVAVVRGIQRMTQQIARLSPDIPQSDVDDQALAALLKESVELAAREQNATELLKAQQAQNIEIHKAQVTPCGIYLAGPSPETKNRVLREYIEYIDYFLRVEFLDEDGERVRFDPRAGNTVIFRSRFRGVLTSGIKVGGRTFQFLGFSHSSLRSQTCWFVAPFTTKSGEYFDSMSIVRKLGYFDAIRSPAKQAARIGQAFSDTLTSIRLSRDSVDMHVHDIERNGRVFSDGVGTISPALVYKVWREYALREKVKPTVFQIRIGGAKGMISLDVTEQGERLKLRDSMIKFPSPGVLNLEICGSGIRALPFCLNNQLTKILEDLGIPAESFFRLQQDEICRLQSAMKSTRAAVSLLEGSHIPKSAEIPWLVNILQGLGLDYLEDKFLDQVMRLVILTRLRDLKYRGRIPVPKAVTLYGIMDETGYLMPNEIFCCFLSPEGFREVLVRKNVMVTRSPALHPGDVQIVNAVNVPMDSPLRKLHNCVVFSQRGDRDIPSMLSGGDLDGDLYNIIYDDTLIPQGVVTPADYPRVTATDLGRQVTTPDIVNFFLDFMEQDQLGRIAVSHQVLADQRPSGTFDGDCLTLAELHSTAVDFSKTGRPVDLARIPKVARTRPDFLAPGPRVRITDDIELQMEELTVYDDDDDDDRQPMTYYRSRKVLGQLYRRIDDVQFLADVQRTGRGKPDVNKVLLGVWKYVSDETAGFLWDHLVPQVSDIQDMYEDGLREHMQNYSPNWNSSITEVEVFIGTILGQNHKQSRRDRDTSKAMRDDYGRLVEWIISVIRDRENDCVEALERSIAVFFLALQEMHNPGQRRARSRSTSTTRQHKQRFRHQEDKLSSFPWIAAVTCLKEVDRLQRSMPFR